MSLLLDALKKSGAAHPQEGDGQTAAGGKAELSLEEHHDAPKATAQASGNTDTSRSAGGNLFAAKKTPRTRNFNYNLGLVPTALIIGSVLGIAGGVYVWYEIQPPKQVARRVPPPAPAPALAGTPAPAPRPLIQPAPAPVEAAPQAVAQSTQSSIAEQPKATRKPGKSRREGNIQIERQPEVAAVDPTLAAAYQAYQQGEYATAWQRYREVLSKDANNRDALLGLAAIAQQQGQDDASKTYYRQVLALDPRDPVANAGMASFASGDSASKESRLKQLLTQSPQSAALHFALGNLYAGQSHWSDAQQAYFNAYRLEPTNAFFAFNLAASLDHLGQKKPAAQYYQQALQLDPSGNSGFDRAATEQRLNKLNAAER
ncbi:MAG TPA: tetratricopeptide repeat protein [Gallionellaceae bacterium]|nr:tetratricopeptide repeat protein [Gallionellaceae bacterium]